MTLYTKTLATLKLKLSRTLKVGTSRIKFTPKALARIYKNYKDRLWKQVLIEELIKNKELTIVPKKQRLYKIYYKKRDSETSSLAKVKDISSLKYLKQRKMVTRKSLWIRKIRAMRALLKEAKGSLKTYQVLRKEIKGNKYKTIKDLRKVI